jgi:hypothetical protein
MRLELLSFKSACMAGEIETIGEKRRLPALMSVPGIGL